MRVSIQDFKEQTIAIGFACRITWQHETFNVTWRYSTWEIMSWCRDGKVMGIENWWKCHVFWAIAALDRISIRLWSVPLRSSDSGTAWQGRTAWDVFMPCHSSEPRWQSMSCLKYGDVRRSFVIRLLRFSLKLEHEFPEATQILTVLTCMILYYSCIYIMFEYQLRNAVWFLGFRT